MVNAAIKYDPAEIKAYKEPLFLPTPITYGSVNIAQIIGNNHRFDASAYNIEAMNALHKVYKSKFGWNYLLGQNGLIDNAYVGARFKRIYTNNIFDIPFFLPSDIESIYPKPSKYISTKTDTDIDYLRVRENMLLVSVSGTIGKTTIVRKRLAGSVFSHDLLRILFKNEYDLGFVYAFLNTKIGHTILQSNNYGAVIDHVEPEHLSRVPIPNAPEDIKKEIHNLIIESFDLRDQSNDLIDKAQNLLYQELQLPNINEIRPKYYSEKADIRIFNKKISNLNLRIDASYHLPIVNDIIELISKNSEKVTTIGNPKISTSIILPGRFKRIYVDEEHGIPFFGGKQLLSLTPSNVKYLSKAHHGERITDQLTLEENMCVVSRSGTIGKTIIVPRHWAGWILNEHCIRIKPSSKEIAGYIYAWLDSPYCHPLIVRYTYGSVVDEIDNVQLSNVPIPLLKNKHIQKIINDNVLKANTIRYQAYLKEQDAINKMNEILNN